MMMVRMWLRRRCQKSVLVQLYDCQGLILQRPGSPAAWHRGRVIRSRLRLAFARKGSNAVKGRRLCTAPVPLLRCDSLLSFSGPLPGIPLIARIGRVGLEVGYVAVLRRDFRPVKQVVKGSHF